jgi:hypothetical protein
MSLVLKWVLSKKHSQDFFSCVSQEKKVFLTLTPDQKEREDENLKVILRLSEPTIEVDNPS